MSSVNIGVKSSIGGIVRLWVTRVLSLPWFKLTRVSSTYGTDQFLIKGRGDLIIYSIENAVRSNRTGKIFLINTYVEHRRSRRFTGRLSYVGKLVPDVVKSYLHVEFFSDLSVGEVPKSNLDSFRHDVIEIVQLDHAFLSELILDYCKVNDLEVVEYRGVVRLNLTSGVDSE